MCVLEEDAAHPFAGREEEHVVAPGVGPIGDRHPRAVARHEPAEKNQRERCDGGDQGHAVEGAVVGVVLHH